MTRVSTLKAIACGILLASCRDAGSSVLPSTPLGAFARDWLFAHNQGDGHAFVHFTLENRGTGQMTGSQVDSAVFDGVRFARELGQLEPTRLLQSTDSSLAILLRSAKGSMWRAEFKPAAQPSAVKVRVEIRTAS